MTAEEAINEELERLVQERTRVEEELVKIDTKSMALRDILEKVSANGEVTLPLFKSKSAAIRHAIDNNEHGTFTAREMLEQAQRLDRNVVMGDVTNLIGVLVGKRELVVFKDRDRETGTVTVYAKR